MSEPGEQQPKNRRPLLIGCLAIVALVIGVPVACTAILSTGDPRDTHNVSASTAEALGFEWPLSVQDGLIWCVGAGRLVFETDGTQYALNGLAKGTGEYEDISPIWLDNPDLAGTKVDIGGLISYGNSVCNY